MRFPPSFLDDIRARLPVSEVVGRRVRLKKQGREWRGLSPFNAEKTPSFYVNDQKGFYHCFSSGKHGDIFRFLMETEGVTFPEAVERLAGEAGLAMPEVSPEAAVREAKKRSLFDVMELAAAFFEEQLQTRPGIKARAYLAQRGLEAKAQAVFRMGYAPADRSALREHLAGKDVALDDMIACGLLISGDDIPVAYDRFRDRVMFPILDLSGRIVAFGGRALDPAAPAKYLNSPETELFHKSDVLFNARAARAAAHKGEPIIVAEGYVDVISLVMAGFAGAVAPLGTALTENQLDLLWRMTDEPILCFDGDKAGQRAAFRAVDIALPKLKPGKSLRFASLPGGQDPDDLIRSRGRSAMEAVLAQSRPLVDIAWDREREAQAADTPERRAALEARLKALVQQIGDETVRRYYRTEIDRRLDEMAGPPVRFAPGRGGGPGQRRFGNDKLRNVRAGPSASLVRSAVVRGAAATLPPRECLIVIATLNHPELAVEHAEALSTVDFASPEVDQLRRAVLALIERYPAIGAADLKDLLEREGHGPLIARISGAITHRGDWFLDPKAGLGDVSTAWQQALALQHRMRTLNKELRDAEQAYGDAPTEANWSWLVDVKTNLASAEGTEALIDGFGAFSGRASRGG